MQEFNRMDVECCCLLARFLSKFAKGAAWWYPILPNVQNNLSSFLGLDYHPRYIPLLCKCELVRERVTKKDEKLYMISQTATSKAGGYSWNAFFTEYNLHDCELTTCYIKQHSQKITFLHIGVFNKDKFNPIDRYRLNIPRPGRKEIRKKQISFSRKLASILPLNVDNKEVNGDELEPKEKELNLTNVIEFGKEEPSVENLKILLKINFFAPILKSESDFNAVWAAIDTTKLANAMSSIIGALQKYFCDKGKAERALFVRRNSNDSSPVEKEKLDLKQGYTATDFPVLNHFCVPHEKFWINGLLQDLMKLSKSVDAGGLLNFTQYNDCEVTLVPVPTSSSYYRFERNMKDCSWFRALLGALSSSPDSSLSWLMKSLTKLHNEEFITAAEAAGLLLNGKVMDAESAAAMWEEANINCQQQRTILRHLACYFG
jgi:hypothetical protein